MVGFVPSRAVTWEPAGASTAGVSARRGEEPAEVGIEDRSFVTHCQRSYVRLCSHCGRLLHFAVDIEN
jgi:hypothetical protein